MKYSVSQCYSCQQKTSHEKLNKELVQNKSVLLCNFCKSHFLKHGYVPQPLVINKTTCTVCDVSELDTYLYQANSLKFSKKYCEKCYKKKYGEPNVKKASEVTHEKVLASLNNPPKKKNHFLFGGLSFFMLLVTIVIAGSLSTNYKAKAEMKSEINDIREMYKNIINPLTIVVNDTNEQVDHYIEDYSSYNLNDYSVAINPIQKLYKENSQLKGDYAEVALKVNEQLDIIQSIHNFLLEPISDTHDIRELNEYLMELQIISDRTLENLEELMISKNIGYKYENKGIYFYSK